jgi:transposase
VESGGGSTPARTIDAISHAHSSKQIVRSKSATGTFVPGLIILYFATFPRASTPAGGCAPFSGGVGHVISVHERPTKRGKGTKIIALADDHSLPLAVSVESASPHESQLVEGVLGHSFLDTLPPRLIGDKAYDSDRLDRDLAERYGIEMIAPHRGARRTPTQDGRPLCRYRRRWRVERLFAWLHHFRRLVIRWEYHVENFFGMVRLGCMQILLRYL